MEQIKTIPNSIWKISGFPSYLWVAFINAFTDVGHKILLSNVIFKYYNDSEQVAWTAVVNALILLPFVMTFTPSGYLSDKYPKHKIIAFTAKMVVPITGLITLFYYMGAFVPAFAMTFLLALQSAVYSPSKYGYLRELVGERNLSAGNGALQGATIAAILSSTALYSLLFELCMPATFETKGDILVSIAPLGFLLVLGGVLESFLSRRIPKTSKVNDSMSFDFSQYVSGSYLRKNLSVLWSHPIIIRCIAGLSIFWGVNQAVLASLGAYVETVSGVSNVAIVNGVLGIAGVGVITGSFIAGKWSKNVTSVKMVIVGCVGMFTFLMLMTASPYLGLTGKELASTPAIVYVLFLFSFCYGTFGGLYVVPLSASIQYHSPKNSLGKVLAGDNFFRGIVMLSFLFGTFSVSKFNWLSLMGWFYVLCFCIVGMGWATYCIWKGIQRQ